MPNDQPAETVRPDTGPTVGVVGLGAIGAGVATSVLREGLPLVVCDVRPEATEPYLDRAQVAATPADLVGRSDVVVVAVVNDEQVHAVLSGPDGGLAAAGPDTIFVVVSTISAPCVQAIGAEADALGVAVLDCGVTGGPEASASGDLVAMVGGDPAVIERAGPVLDSFTSLVVTMGPLGCGLNAKLARNLVQYGSWLAAYEARSWPRRPGSTWPSWPRSSGRATSNRRGVAPHVPGHRGSFPEADDKGIVGAMEAGASLAHKDLAAAIELAESLDVDLPLAAMTERRCDEVFGLGEVSA